MSEQRLIDANKIDFKEIFGGESDFAKDTREAAQMFINSQPTIEAEPVQHGEWENYTGYDDWHCSECGFEINYDGDYPTEYDNFKFCGCCGAKMDKEC